MSKPYAEKFAATFGLRLFYAWRIGGFRQEMLRNNTKTAPVKFTKPDETIGQAGGTINRLTTRMQFPAIGDITCGRWCTPLLKIGPSTAFLNNVEELQHSRTLYLSGERAQESVARAKYAQFETHGCDKRDNPKLKRHVDHCRIIHQFSEEQVWGLIREHGINVPVVYHIGYSRYSCKPCIFGQCDEWATLRVIAPKLFFNLLSYEVEFNKTINYKRVNGEPVQVSILEKANAGTPFPGAYEPALVWEVNNRNWNGPIILDRDDWVLPAGAFKGGSGPW
jgi:3'-phosphoadenosine 5'-phosphosulfate sulfotransferase (PAPS reductase)/FAD synthetase